MSRIGSTVIVFLLLINGMSGAMAASGINDDLGVTLNPGIENQIETITENAVPPPQSPNRSLVCRLPHLVRSRCS